MTFFIDFCCLCDHLYSVRHLLVWTSSSFLYRGCYADLRLHVHFLCPLISLMCLCGGKPRSRDLCGYQGGWTSDNEVIYVIFIYRIAGNIGGH